MKETCDARRQLQNNLQIVPVGLAAVQFSAADEAVRQNGNREIFQGDREMKWIYRLDDPRSGKCIYVGQTKTLRVRRSTHLRRWPDGRFVPLRQCADSEALRLERQITLAYKRRGEAQQSIQYMWPNAHLQPNVSKLLCAFEGGASHSRIKVQGYQVSGAIPTFAFKAI